MAKRAPKTPTITILDRAIAKAQESEAPFYESMKLMKQAADELRPVLAEGSLYFSAMRALYVIAHVPCESGDAQPQYPDCPSALAAKAMEKSARCWPCYARHVLGGGAP